MDNPEARAAYEKASQQLLDRLLAISHYIETEREVLRNFAVNWGHVGNMEYANESLNEISEFLRIESKKG